MQLGDFLLALACAKGGTRKAVLLVKRESGQFPKIIDCAEQSDLTTYDTPVVNLLQNLGVSKVRGFWLYATYVPDEMDLGMACMRQVAGIVYPSGPDVASQRTLSDETGPGAATGYDEYNRFSLDLTARFVVAALDAPWARAATKWQDRSWVGRWMNALRTNRLANDAFAIRKSYDGLNQPWSRRPKDVMDDLSDCLSQGLDGVDYAPCAGLTARTRDQVFMMAALALVGCAWSTKGSKSTRTTTVSGGHNIGAVMVNTANQVIGWGLNISELNGTLHAETAMVLAYLRRHNVSRLPDGVRIYATLKPCHMCAGFIATVAKDVTVIYAQNDPKITNSALDAKRGQGINQLSSEVTIGGSATFGTFDPRGRTMTVTDVLSEMITSSGLAAVPFLYSANANKFFTKIRGKAWELEKAVKKFEALPPALSHMSIRTTGPEPETGFQTIPFATMGLLKKTTFSSSASGLDLATGVAVIHLPKHIPVPVTQLNRGQVRQKGAHSVEFTNPSRRIQGLDLELGNIDVVRRMGRRADPTLLRGILGGLGAVQHFLQRLNTLNVIDFG